MAKTRRKAATPDLVPFAEAAGMMAISAITLERLLKRPGSDVPNPFRIGRQRFYQRSTIEAYVARKVAAAEAEAEARLRDYVSPLAAFIVPPQCILQSAFVT